MNHSILVVDDEEQARNVVAELAAAAGYVVHTAASGEEALALLDGGLAADLVITDNNMGCMNGMRLIEEVKRRWPSRRAILCTGGDAESLTEAAGLAGADALFEKPVSGPVLIRRIGELLG